MLTTGNSKKHALQVNNIPAGLRRMGRERWDRVFRW